MQEQFKLARLKKAFARARVDFAEVIPKLRSGEYQFLEVGNACAVTHIGISGAFRTLYVLAVAGELADVPALAIRIEEFGRHMGCQALETDGRLGFERVLEQFRAARGYKPVSVKYRKEL
jgi:hypothetical protein